jgi:hypothetical protein
VGDRKAIQVNLTFGKESTMPTIKICIERTNGWEDIAELDVEVMPREEEIMGFP